MTIETIPETRPFEPTTLTKKQKLAIVDAVLRLNASLLGQEQDVFVTTMSKGWVRVGYRRGVVNAPRSRDIPSRSYPSADAALTAAWVSLERARALFDDVEPWWDDAGNDLRNAADQVEASS